MTHVSRILHATMISSAAAGVLLGGCIALTDFHDYDTSRGIPDGSAPVEASGSPTIAPLDAVVVRRGTSATLAVVVDRHGTTGPIQLDVTSLPEGVTAVPIQIPSDGSGATISILTTDAAPLGSLTAFVRATATMSGVSVKALLTVTITSTRLDPTFGDGGLVVGAADEVLQDFVTDQAGTGFAAVDALGAGDAGVRPLLVYRIDGSGGLSTLLRRDDGTLDHRATFLANGRLAITAVDNAGATISAYEPSSAALVWSLTLDPTTARGAQPVAAPDGTLFVTSGGSDPMSGTSAVFVQHISAAGTLDPAFGSGGLVLPLRATSAERPGAAVFTARGLVVCSTRGYDDGSVEIVLRRLTDLGQLDVAFGAAGEVAFRPGIDTVHCVDVVVDGTRLIVATTVGLPKQPASVRAALFAVDFDGVIDSSFGVDGVTRHESVGTAVVAAAAVSVDGARLYSAATDERGALVIGDLANGREDRSFGPGDGGAFSAAFATTSAAVALRVLGDGRILVAGTTKLGGAITWYVARIVP